jgi:hypothetical protein
MSGVRREPRGMSESREPAPHAVDLELLGFLDGTRDDDMVDILIGEWPDLPPKERAESVLPYGFD